MSVQFLAVQPAARDPYTALKSMQLRPTIYLGLGGLGSESVGKIKLLYERTFSNLRPEGATSAIPPAIRFLAFDSDVKGKPDELTKDQEWFQMKAPNIGRVLPDLFKEPYYADWIPHITGHDFESGCGGFRALGRLLFNRNTDLFDSQFQAARKTVMAVHGVAIPQPLVCVFAGLAGGTGSGFLLDACFYIRQNLPEADIYGFLAVVDGAVANNPVRELNAKIGVYSALREVDAFMDDNRLRGGPYESGNVFAFPSQVPMHGRYDRPFNRCLLIGQRNAAGTENLDSRKKLSSFMARAAFMMNAYTAGTEQGVRSFESEMNDKVAMQEGVIKDALARYVVPGLGQIHFPTELTADYLQCHVGSKLLGFLSGGDAHPDAESERYFSMMGLRWQNVADRLAVDGAGKPLQPQDFTASIAKALADEKYRYSKAGREALLGYGEAMAGERRTEHKARMDGAWSVLLEKASKDCHELVASVMSDARFRTVGASDLVKDLRRLFAREHSAVDAVISGPWADVQRDIQSQWGSVRPAVLDVCTRGGLLDLDRMKIKKTAQLYSSFLNAADVRMLELAAYERTKEFFAALDTLLGTLERELDMLREVLVSARSLVRTEENALATRLHAQTTGAGDSPDDICSFSVLDEAWRKKYLADERLRDEAVLAQVSSGDFRPINLLSTAKGPQPAAEVAQRVCDLVDLHVTGSVRHMTLARLIKGEDGAADVAAHLARLINSHTQAQMTIAGMNTYLGYPPRPFGFVGGLDDESFESLKASNDFPEVMRATSHERGKVSVIEFHHPVALAGIDLLHNHFDTTYNQWRNDLKRISRKEDRELVVRSFRCYPGSETWQAPVHYKRAVSEETTNFALAFAVSVICSPDRFPKKSDNRAVFEGALMAVERVSKTPKEKRLGIFKIGKSDFWLTFPFDVHAPADVKRPLKLGSTISKARKTLATEMEAREGARGWETWIRENWSSFFTDGEVRKAFKEAAAEAVRLQSMQELGSPDEKAWGEVVQVLQSVERDGL